MIIGYCSLSLWIFSSALVREPLANPLMRRYTRACARLLVGGNGVFAENCCPASTACCHHSPLIGEVVWQRSLCGVMAVVVAVVVAVIYYGLCWWCDNCSHCYRLRP